MMIKTNSEFTAPMASWRRAGVGALLLTLGLAGCSHLPTEIQAPLGFEGQSLSLPAANRSRATGWLVDESFDLGPYRVTGIEGKASSSGDSVQIDGLKIEKRRSSFSYHLLGGNANRSDAQAHCASNSQDTRLPVFNAVTVQRYKVNFSCDCRTQDGHVAKLSIASDSGWQGAAGSNPVRLSITVDEVEYPLGRFNAQGRTVPDDEPFAGYRVDGPSGAVAALGLRYPGTVWLHERLPAAKREAMTCALAGLMLHRGP